jgi:RNA polymerase sigma-70 factor (ECF subfamily)
VNGEVIEELAAAPAAELELRYQQDIAPGASPEDAYRRSFALEVLSRAFARLRDEACETDHLDMYDALEPFMALDPTPGQQESLASRLHSRPLALIVALKRLRQRFRELVDAELADLVASPAEMLAEQHALHAVLRVRR